MKRDEVRAIFGEITDEQLKAIMDLNGADVNAERKKADGLKERLDDAEARLEAAEKAAMASDEGKATLEERVKAMEESYAAEKRALSMERNTLAAAKTLAAAGITDEDSAQLMGFIVSEDADETAKAAKAVADMVSAKVQQADQGARQAMLASTRKPEGSSGSAGTVTKEQFDAMGYEERLKVFNETPDLFKELNEQ